MKGFKHFCERIFFFVQVDLEISPKALVSFGKQSALDKLVVMHTRARCVHDRNHSKFS